MFVCCCAVVPAEDVDNEGDSENDNDSDVDDEGSATLDSFNYNQFEGTSITSPFCSHSCAPLPSCCRLERKGR